MWHTLSDLLITDLGDELVLLHPGQSEMFSLNAAGRELWYALPATLDDLADLLVRRYGIDSAQALRDVQEVLTQLQERGLVSAS